MAAKAWKAAAVLVILAVVVGVFVLGYVTSQPKTDRAVRVIQTSLDQIDAPEGQSVYLLQLNVSNAGAADWEFNPQFLKVVSNDSHTFTVDTGYNWTSLLGGARLLQGTHAIGLEAFELPRGEGPSRLQYSDPAAGINLDAGGVPQVSAVASRLALHVRLTVNGLAYAASGWTVAGCPATIDNSTDRWVCSIQANGAILNNSLVFFTGQTMQVGLWFEYLRQPADPQTITLESLVAGGGFQIIKGENTIPVSLTGWGSETVFTLLVRVPQGQHSGTLEIGAHFSG